MKLFRGFFARLRQGDCKMKVVGRASVEQIAGILHGSLQWKVPMISHHLLATLKKKGKDAKEILQHGTQHTRIKYFPAVRKSNASAHPYLNWQLDYGVWLIICEGKVISHQS